MLFKNKNFQLLLWSRISSNIGDSIFYIVSMWAILEISGSPMLTGLAGFLFTLPSIFNVLFGPLIDRSNPKKLYIFASILQVLLLGVILITVGIGDMNVWMLLFIIFFLTIFSEVVYPIENVLIPKVVKKSQLVKANSVMSVAYQGLDFVFNGLSGILIGFLAISMLYSLNLVFFLIPIFLMLLLKVNISKEKREGEGNNYKKELLEGLKVVNHPLLRAFLIPLTIINFLFAMILVTLPSFANQYGNGPSTYGLTIAFLGLGSMLGALFIDKFRTKQRLGIMMSAGFILSGCTWLLMVFSIQLSEIIFYILLAISYAFIGAINVLFTVLFQKLPEEKMLGRVNTAIESIISFAMPIGSLAGGFLTELASPIFVLCLFGIGLIILGGFYLFNRSIQNLPDIDKVEKLEW
ncbi:MFS transporter [Oceanobacillus neutriphilus]|uniref:MFS transporter n=1 Tax=Oceanobacillus neutriphilus TaxID=531815 RepID=A0ABQ2NSG5_9BACI|nr:MFS transporter [Oceanobacillus neutriphilus]GGP09030.1 MFS transporter [Oceanobacillus neutriphilus]